MTRDPTSPGIGFICRISKDESHPTNSEEHGRIALITDRKLHIGLLLHHVHCTLFRCRRVWYKPFLQAKSVYGKEDKEEVYRSLHLWVDVK